MSVLYAVLSIAMSVFMFIVGPLRIIGIPIARADAVKFGMPFGLYRSFGVIEVVGAICLLVGLAVHPLGTAAAVAVALLAIGTLVVHIRAGEPVIKVTLAALTASAALLLAVLSTLR